MEQEWRWWRENVIIRAWKMFGITLRGREHLWEAKAREMWERGADVRAATNKAIVLTSDEWTR